MSQANWEINSRRADIRKPNVVDPIYGDKLNQAIVRLKYSDKLPRKYDLEVIKKYLDTYNAPVPSDLVKKLEVIKGDLENEYL